MEIFVCIVAVLSICTVTFAAVYEMHRFVSASASRDSESVIYR